MLLSIISLLAWVFSSLSNASWTRGNDFQENARDGKTVRKLTEIPMGWRKDETIDLDRVRGTVKLRIHLVQQNKNEFYDLATKIATPEDDLYGKHLSQEEIDTMLAPKQESSDLVMQWLGSYNLSSKAVISPRLNVIFVYASISQVEELLKTEYSYFEHEQSGEKIIRTLEYSLPDILQDHVQMIQPTTFFGFRERITAEPEIIHRATHSVNSESNYSMAPADNTNGCHWWTWLFPRTPECLASLYNFASSTNVQSEGLIGVVGFLGEIPRKLDLIYFLSNNGIGRVPEWKVYCTSIHGGDCNMFTKTPGIEANLDLQYAAALTKRIPLAFFSVNGTILRANEPNLPPYVEDVWFEFLDFLASLSSNVTRGLPNTLSISYQSPENLLPQEYMTEMCDQFAKVGARGVSVIVPSGDDGTGTYCVWKGKYAFQPEFPSSCPWVTSVGGTQSYGPEEAWERSGGGFSLIFPRPSYQDSAIAKWKGKDRYYKRDLPYINVEGRGYPDVSAQAVSFRIWMNGWRSTATGTSASVPVIASLVQLLSSERLAAGKPPMGFLNPWIYGKGSTAFTDITTGAVRGCERIPNWLRLGFLAVDGWDPTTGIGTPNYGAMLLASQIT